MENKLETEKTVLGLFVSSVFVIWFLFQHKYEANNLLILALNLI